MTRDSYVQAIEVVTLGVTLIGVIVLKLVAGSDKSADVTVGITIIRVSVRGPYRTALVAVGVAYYVIVYVIGRLTLEAANVTNAVAVVAPLVGNASYITADVTIGIAFVGPLVGSVSFVTAIVTLGVTAVIEVVKTFPRSGKSDSLGDGVGIKVPTASVGKDPAEKIVAVPYRSRGLANERADINSDMVEL